MDGASGIFEELLTDFQKLFFPCGWLVGWLVSF
jgi:hypothetical protein